MIKTTSFGGFSFRYSYETTTPFDDTIIYVGGTFQKIESTNKPFRLWPENLNSLIIELPGFGLSDHLPSEFDIQFYSDCIKHVIQLCELEKSKLIAYAYSYGTGPLHRYVSNNQEQFKCLIIGGATTNFSQEMKNEIGALIELADNKSPYFKDEFTTTFVNENLPKNIYRKTKTLLKFMLKSVNEKDLKNFAHNYRRLLKEHNTVPYINTPTMVMIGGLDKFTRYAQLEELDTHFENVNTVKLDNCDHFYHIQSDQSLRFTEYFIEQHQGFDYLPKEWDDNFQPTQSNLVFQNQNLY